MNTSVCSQFLVFCIFSFLFNLLHLLFAFVFLSFYFNCRGSYRFSYLWQGFFTFFFNLTSFFYIFLLFYKFFFTFFIYLTRFFLPYSFIFQSFHIFLSAWLPSLKRGRSAVWHCECTVLYVYCTVYVYKHFVMRNSVCL